MGLPHPTLVLLAAVLLAPVALAPIAMANGAIEVRVSGSDAATTGPAYLQDVVISATSPAFVSGSEYALGWAFATDDAFASETELSITLETVSWVDATVTAGDGVLTWAGPWGSWLDPIVSANQQWALTFFATRLFVVSAGDAVPTDADAIDATLAASPTIFPGRDDRTGTFDVSGRGYVDGAYVADEEITISAVGWGEPNDVPAQHAFTFGAILLSVPDGDDVHRAFWDAYYRDVFEDDSQFQVLEVLDDVGVTATDQVASGGDTDWNLTYELGTGFSVGGKTTLTGPLPPDAAAWRYYWHTTSDGDVWLASGSSVDRAETRSPSPPATILTPPADATAYEEDAAAFTVTVSASGTPTYQWQTAPPAGAPWSDVPGATDATWTFAPVGRDDDGMQVRVRVGNTEPGDATTVTASDAATLTVVPVTPAPTTIDGPFDVAVVRGAPAPFTVSATSPHALSYAWERDDGAGWTAVPDVATATWTLSPTTLADDGTRVRAIVTAREGEFEPAVVTTPAAQLVVHADDAPAEPGAWPAPGGAWLVGDLPPSDDLVNVEVQIDDGVWRTLSPADVTPPFAVSGLPDGTPVEVRFRGVYDGGARGAPSPALRVTPGRPAAPPLTVRLPADADTILAARDGEAVRVDVDVEITHGGSDVLRDAWLDLTPLEAAGGARVEAVVAGDGGDPLPTYEGMWLWRDANLPAGATRTLTLTFLLDPEATE